MTEPLRGPDCLSRLRCDQLLNGELEDRDDLKAHAASCERCAALLASHRSERAMFSIALRRRRPRRRLAAASVAIAAAFGLWLVVVRERDGDRETRPKGKPALGFYLKRGDTVRKGGTGEIVLPNDALNFTASTERPGFLAIISIDGARHISVYYPDGPTTAPLGAGQEQALPLSVVLDDVLGPEQLIGVFCDQPMSLERLVAPVALGIVVPDGCATDTLLIEKRRTP